MFREESPGVSTLVLSWRDLASALLAVNITAEALGSRQGCRTRCSGSGLAGEDSYIVEDLVMSSADGAEPVPRSQAQKFFAVSTSRINGSLIAHQQVANRENSVTEDL